MTRQTPPAHVRDASSIIDILRYRAVHQPEKRAYTFLSEGEAEEIYLTYGELDRRARASAARLQSQDLAGRRVLLLYPPGLDYVSAFYGCLYAGAIPVLAFPPRASRHTHRLQAILADAQATNILTTQSLFSDLERRLAPLSNSRPFRCLTVEDLPDGAEDDWHAPATESRTPAFLQYTSGSTSAPKGVMVGHANLLHNLSVIYHGFDSRPDEEVGVFWLPIYHDMGLVGGILGAVYIGFSSILMSPASFLQRPVRWLEAITRYRGNLSGAPNFAYQLCIDRITPEQRASLDLSSWRAAFCGAEPISNRTLNRFADIYEAHGFRREAFYPCYGMAEATLFISGGRGPAAPKAHTVERAALADNRVVETTETGKDACQFVSCGRALLDQKIVIANPTTLSRCLPDEVGEVWVSSPSVALGYWNRPEETERVFQAHLADTGEGPFMRTGDLGYLHEEELFITGRLKDLIVIRGHNHYPQDIELTVEQSHPALQAGGGAAFSVETGAGGEERLVVVQEVERRYRHVDVGEALAAIRRAVAEQHELQVHAVVLIKPLSIPKTSSGKIRRQECRARFMAGSLDVLAEWVSRQGDGNADAAQDGNHHRASQATQQTSPRTVDAIRDWLVAQLCERLQIDAVDVNVGEPFASHGVDSLQVVQIAGELEVWLERPLSPTLLYEYPTIEAIAQHLGETANTHGATFERDDVRDDAQDRRTEPIAVIGIGCRFPGAQGPEGFWQLLREGVDAITEIPRERWNAEALYDPDPDAPGKLNTRWGGFLNHIDQFDPSFFKIAHREAVRIDPQQRLLLETAWEALEDAGLSAERLAGSRAGVFIGISTNDYSRLENGNSEPTDAYAATGNAFSIAANRLSYAFDLRGPSIAIDTACSSSLVAVHLACRSLRSGESTLALAGGVNLLLSPTVAMNFTKARMMAADGRCKTFDARADGYVRSEGVGVVVLKPLSAALADGDSIYALIRGSAVNQDGRTNGLMAPNPQAQEAVLTEAYKDAGVSPGLIQYVEAHGTGTLLGDPIEANALGRVLAAGRPSGNVCRIGSVKTNIGHLEAAAGVAGLIKVALMLRHKQLPPSLHFEKPNQYIPFAELSLSVQQSLDDWPEDSADLLAGVSSFGFGGTNAHVVLSQAPQGERREEAEDVSPVAQILPLSAHTTEALRDNARRMCEFLARPEALSERALRDMCFTAGARRTHHDRRLAIVFHKREELIARLASFERGETQACVSTGRRVAGRRPKLAFIFSGQGTQTPAMGRELFEHEPAFRSTLETCDRLLRPFAEWSLLEELFADESRSRLAETEIAQPALVALQLSLVALWRQWGIAPDAVVGHSIGEVAAAHVAGALSLEDALRVAFHRGRLMQRATGRGRMAAVAMPPEKVEEEIAKHDGRLCVAAINSSNSTIISGDSQAVEGLLETFRRQEIFCRALPINYAFHSGQMDFILPEFLDAIRPLDVQPVTLPIYSTLTGHASNGGDYDAHYWQRQIRQPVRFAAAIDELIKKDDFDFLEIGSHPALSVHVKQGLTEHGRERLVLPSMRRGSGERESLLTSLGALYAHGHAVEWSELYTRGGRCVSLPTYSWQHERCWPESVEVETATPKERARKARGDGHAHPLLGEPLNLAASSESHMWENRLDNKLLPYLADHKFQGVELLPGTAYLEMALAAASEIYGDVPRALSKVKFHRPLFSSESNRPTLQLILSPNSKAEASFRIFSRPEAEATLGDSWRLHAQGTVEVDLNNGDASVPTQRIDLEAVRARCGQQVSDEAFYSGMSERGLQYGTAFRGVKQLRRCDGEALGTIEVPRALESELNTYQLHPAILDACAQVLIAADEQGDKLFLPISAEAIRVYKRPGLRIHSYARVRTEAAAAADGLVGDVLLLDEDGEVLIEALGLRIQYLDGAEQSFLRADLDEWLYELEWQPKNFSSNAQATQSEQELSPCGTWLALVDESGVGEALAKRIEEAGGRCIRISTGTAFERTGGDHFRLRPAHAEDTRKLFDALAEEGVLPCRGVLHLWSLDATQPEQTTVASLEQAQARGTATVVAFLREMGSTEQLGGARLWLVTRDVHVVPEGVGKPCIAQSPLWGLGRTIAQEHASIWGGLVDLESGVPAAESSAMLWDVLRNAEGENQIALRKKAAYVARLIRKAKRGAASTARRRRPDASYLITGGLGELGLLVSRWIVEQGARRVILLGRTQLPARSEWNKIEEKRLKAQIAAIKQLESLGASVHLASVDVSDEKQLAQFLATFREEGWPPVGGVIHAAGVLQDRVLSQIGEAAMGEVFRAKVIGGWLLHRLLEDSELDFFVMFSSAASLLGSAGQGNYAAANMFLDALAHYRRSQGKAAMSINWGPWAEVGMASKRERAERLARKGIGSIPPETGLEIFGRLLRQDSAQVGVLPLDWSQLFQHYPELGDAPLLAELKRTELGAASEVEGTGENDRRVRETILAAAPSERLRLIETFLAAQVSGVIGLSADRIEAQQSLNSLGIDSLMSIELKNRIEAELGVVIPVVKLLEGPTIAEFSELLSSLVGALPVSASVPAQDRRTVDVQDSSRPIQIITIRSEGSKPRFFCIHPGALDVYCYSDLSKHLGTEQPFYALQPTVLDNYRVYRADADEAAADSNIEEVAASCIKALQSVESHGPYFLGGWSLGGVVAFEMAQQLGKQGERVALLALFDAPAPFSGSRPEADYVDAELIPVFARYMGARRGKRLQIPSDDFRAVETGEVFRRVWEQVKAFDILPAENSFEQFRSLFQIYKNGLQKATGQLWRYEPQVYSGDITLFQTLDRSESFDNLFPDAAAGWSQTVSSPITIRHLPGDHYTIFLEPEVQTLAEQLKHCIETARI
jgi:acyl transferase domain-containing protein/acyl-CoA synthetase (AMP-forming)/AMP-acid ligase II/thioesterase domain-containing protein/acyl carrier protein